MNLLENSAEFMASLCLFGVIAALYRLPRASRPDILAAFIIFMFGSFFREIVVYVYGGITWPATAIYLSTISRVVQIIGAALFIRASTVDKCGEWGWTGVLLASTLLVIVF